MCRLLKGLHASRIRQPTRGSYRQQAPSVGYIPHSTQINPLAHTKGLNLNRYTRDRIGQSPLQVFDPTLALRLQDLTAS